MRNCHYIARIETYGLESTKGLFRQNGSANGTAEVFFLMWWFQVEVHKVVHSKWDNYHMISVNMF